MYRNGAWMVIAWLAAAVVAASGEARLGEPFELRAGESASIESAGITLTFEGVSSDSRCPEDVDCIRAGEAWLDFLAHWRSGRSEPFQIEVPPRAGGEARVAGYRIEVLALDPPASSDRPLEPEDYVATVRVTRPEGAGLRTGACSSPSSWRRAGEW